MYLFFDILLFLSSVTIDGSHFFGLLSTCLNPRAPHVRKYDYPSGHQEAAFSLAKGCISLLVLLIIALKVLGCRVMCRPKPTYVSYSI